MLVGLASVPVLGRRAAGQLDMSVASFVAKLIAAGTPPELAAEVVAEVFAEGILSACPQTSRDESVTHRRESDRLRKQRSRDNLRTSRDVTGQSQDASLSKSSIKEEREEPVTSVRGQRLPEFWEPLPEDANAANSSLGYDRTKSELLKFRDHWKQQAGSKGVKLDWDAAWRNWIRRAEEFYEKSDPPAIPEKASLAPTQMDWEKACAFFKANGKWFRDYGPEPGLTGCRCPPEILERHGLQRRQA
jgi:hypothetical protein